MIDRVKEIISYAKNLCQDTDFEVRLTTKTLLGNKNIYGYITANFESSKREIVISLRNLILHFGNDKSFVETLITIHHEYKHITQFNEILEGRADDIILIDYLMREKNDELYYNNYKILPFAYEIEAEAEGILNTYDYLKEFHSKDIDALGCIRQIIHSKIQRPNPDPRYLNDKIIECKDIKSIKEGFNELYLESIKKGLNVKEILSDYTNGKYFNKISNNIIYGLIKDIGYEGFTNIMEYVRNDQKGRNQSKFIASYLLYLNPNIKDYFDLSVIEPIDYNAYKYAAFKIRHDPMFNSPLVVNGTFEHKVNKIEKWIDDYNLKPLIKNAFLNREKAKSINNSPER